MPQQIQQVQIPNFAAAIMQGQETKTARRATQNAAALKYEELQFKKGQADQKQKQDKVNFIDKIFSGVTTEEQFHKAGELALAKYPEEAQSFDALFPRGYDQEKLNLFKRALQTTAQSLEQESIRTAAPGSALFTRGGGLTGESVPATPKAGAFEIFEGPDKNQVWIEKGKAIPKGFRKVKGGGPNININTGQVAKTTKAKLEGDVIEATRNIQSFQETRDKFKPEYLTLFGKGKKITAKAMDVAGVSTEGQKGLIKERQDWFRSAKADFIAYRKWATGVAGGEKELKEIATSFPDPVKNSPTEYEANLDSIEETTKRVLSLNKEFLRSGIDLNQPLDAILNQAKSAGVATPPGTTPSTGAGTGTNSNITLRFDKQGNQIQ